MQKYKNSRNIVENHVNCVQKELSVALRKPRITRNFEKKFLFGGIFPSKQLIKFHRKFNKIYKTLRKKNKILSIVEALQNVTGTLKKRAKERSKAEEEKKMVG